MTQSDDARITRVGRFLRTSRIDELPQIINILRGEMSWIGPVPRPSRCRSGTSKISHFIVIVISCVPEFRDGLKSTKGM
jgi:lipopolysaccharide/colanic/teichoic acid biosynthesis glycosyltransferase